VGHFIGMLNAFLIPLLGGSPVNLADTWDPAQALALGRSDGLTVGGGAPYYMTSLLDHPDFTPRDVAHMKYAGLGGASVPAAVTTRLEGLGITVWRSYGSTEHPSITGSHWAAPTGKRLYTDGSALTGVEIRLDDDGEILSRGPDLCLGYTDRALTERAFDADGWYHTGDIGVLDDEGYLTIADRKSDIIIRGGENVSAAEVEEVLAGMPGVAEAAVVAAPDERLGEHGAAVLRLLPGHPVPVIGDVRAHLERAGLARQKWPEELHAMDELPRTASGKVQKYILRRDIAGRRIGE
jgi:acyl-CoA synthetase (AMP-forming)/AMP-acid ligase II